MTDPTHRDTPETPDQDLEDTAENEAPFPAASSFNPNNEITVTGGASTTRREFRLAVENIESLDDVKAALEVLDFSYIVLSENHPVLDKIRANPHLWVEVVR